MRLKKKKKIEYNGYLAIVEKHFYFQKIKLIRLKIQIHMMGVVIHTRNEIIL